MLLFRPHRGVEDLVDKISKNNRVQGSEDAVWNFVFEEFMRWRKTQVEVVAERALALGSQKTLSTLVTGGHA